MTTPLIESKSIALKVIEEIAKTRGLTSNDILGTGRDRGLMDARAEIAHVLRRTHNLTAKAVATAMGVSDVTVYSHWKRWKSMQQKEISDKMEPPKNKKTVTRPEKSACVTIDFTDRPELLKWINKTAADELRTPEMQMLWLLKSNRETSSCHEI